MNKQLNFAKWWFLSILLFTGQEYILAQGNLKAASNSSVKVRSGQRFYSQGDMLTAKVLFSKALPVNNPWVVAVSTKTGDAEGLQLTKANDLEYVTVGSLKIQYAEGKKENDGVLNVRQGEAIIIYYFNKKLDAKTPVSNPTNPNIPVKQPNQVLNNNKVLTHLPQQQTEADLICDFALIRGQEDYKAQFRINKGFALSKTEDNDNATTLLVENQVPVQIANNRVIYYSKSPQELKEFLINTKGILIGSQDIASNNQKGQQAHLIEVPVKQQNIEDLGQLRQFFGFKQKLFTSNTEALQVINFVSQANLEGYNVSLNPRLQFNSRESEAVQAAFINPGDGETIPNSFNKELTNVRRAWNFMAIFDRDNIPVNVAIIDMGFHTNPDFRNAATMVQCQADALNVRCFAEAAQGIPTVGNSLFGGRSWHGNGVVGRSCGQLNNGFGTAGTGGQVAIPQLIKMSGVETYAFNIAGAIRQAVNNNAHVINISAGFPCRALTSLGDFTYCDPGTRSAICAALFPIIQAGVIIACSALNFIPFIGPALAGGCIAVASSAYIAACIAQIAIGNPGDIINSAVQFAKSRGVPVVASAGNIITPDPIPAELRPFINLDLNRMTVEEWQVVPAGLPDVICVGASHPSEIESEVPGFINFRPFLPLGNNEVFGSRVDVWAPEDGKYFAPASADAVPPAGVPDVVNRNEFGGTSASAPFITGLVANAMALNPQLNRSTSTRLASIANDLRGLLSSSAWQNSDGVLPNDPKRRNLVCPIRFLQKVVAFGGSPIPDLPAGIYGDKWNVESTENTDDATPTVLSTTGARAAVTGSIVHIPGAGTAAALTDRDLYRIPVTTTTAGSLMQLKLRTPSGRRFGNLTIRGLGGTAIRLVRTDAIGLDEEEKIFEGPALTAGTVVNIVVEGQAPTDDNIYVLRIGNAALPLPTEMVRSVTPPALGIQCPNTLVRGDREFGGAPQITITATLQVTADGTGIDAVISFRGREIGGDQSEVTGNWRRRIFNAESGLRITRINSATSTTLDFRGRAGGFEFIGCNDGVVEFPATDGRVIRQIGVIADTGGGDISNDEDCHCDTQIRSIEFNPISINVVRR
ncbi:MAG TPA: S8 family serine peptidase [Chitinophagaceae bacterium]|jgi:hypothetical protein|nr:S8 family serine peptidase [Chitinophagaceae bacterium]